jgi:hypothetical protein
MAIAEIAAGDGVADLQATFQYPDREILGRQFGKSLVEGQRDHMVDAESLQRVELGPERGQAKGRAVGTKERLGMRLEREDRQRLAALAGDRRGLRDHGLMAEMDAVEIAKRHHRAMRVGGQIGFMSIETHRAGSRERQRVDWAGRSLSVFVRRLKIDRQGAHFKERRVDAQGRHDGIGFEKYRYLG